VTTSGPLPDLVLAPDVARVRQSLQPVLELTTSIAASSVPAATGAGLSLIEDGLRMSKASTNALVELADEQQYELGEGPCLTSWADGVLVRMDDLDDDLRYPAWVAAARRLRLRSVLSTPLRGLQGNVGAIKVYSEVPHAFDRSAEDLLLKLSDQAALLVENLQALADAEQSSADIMASMRVRQQVAMAQGVLVGSDGISPEEAFLQLCQNAAALGSTVATVAARILSNR
jgi:GAF domain-containing protein